MLCKKKSIGILNEIVTEYGKEKFEISSMRDKNMKNNK